MQKQIRGEKNNSKWRSEAFQAEAMPPREGTRPPWDPASGRFRPPLAARVRLGNAAETQSGCGWHVLDGASAQTARMDVTAASTAPLLHPSSPDMPRAPSWQPRGAAGSLRTRPAQTFQPWGSLSCIPLTREPIVAPRPARPSWSWTLSLCGGAHRPASLRAPTPVCLLCSLRQVGCHGVTGLCGPAEATHTQARSCLPSSHTAQQLLQSRAAGPPFPGGELRPGAASRAGRASPRRAGLPPQPAEGGGSCWLSRGL